MKYSLSTNWCNTRIKRGEEIAEKALALGFDELELGFRTQAEQVPGFEAMLSRIPVGSIHAFCPVPVSAPSGHPELFQLASFSKAERGLALAHVKNNIRFASRIGADTVVLHAGRIGFSSMFKFIDSGLLRAVFAQGGQKTDFKPYVKLLEKAKRIRRKRGNKAFDIFRRTLDELVPELEKNKVTLALENLPYLEGFPDEAETARLIELFKDKPIRGWFDTGHNRVRAMHGWIDASSMPAPAAFAGMHLNDVVDFNDDHLAPGDGKVDFAALKTFAHGVRHVVFEPHSSVDEDALRRGLARIRAIW